MKLPTKTLLSLALVTIASFGSALWLRHSFVLPQLLELEAQADRKDIERLVIGFDIIRNDLRTLSYDYATRDVTYHYFTDQNDNPVGRYFSPDLFIANELDLLFLADLERNILWRREMDTGRILTAPELDADVLRPHLAEARDARSNAPIANSGFVRTDEAPVVFASTSVLQHNLAGPSPGTLTVGRYVDANMIDDIADTVKLDFEVEVLSPAQAAAIEIQPLDQLYRDQRDRMIWYLRDVQERPLLRLTLHLNSHAFDTELMDRPMLFGFGVMLTCWALIFWRVHAALVRPIRRIVRHLTRIRQTKDYSLRLNISGSDEIAQLGDECDNLIAMVGERERLVHEQARNLRRQSNEDPLTRLPNRRRFDQLLDDYFALAQREQAPLAVLFCDVDHFKAYNDHYGHQQGDDALIKLAEALRGALRRKSEWAARYGGEEFVMLLPNTDWEEAERAAERVHRAVHAAAIPHAWSSAGNMLTFSIGIYVWQSGEPVSGPEELVQRADLALYKAKERGRDRTERYTPELETSH